MCHVATAIDTVAENKLLYTDRQVDRAKLARNIYHALGTPSVADFKSFPAKAASYAEYCNQLYLAVMKPLYEKIKDRIPPGVGCFIFDPEDGRRKPIVKRAKHKELNDEVQRNLCIRAAFRNSDTTNRKNKGNN
jgi:hypothetical protein